MSKSNNIRYYILTFYSASLVLLGFILSSPKEIYEGLGRIVLGEASLISDYFVLGGAGAALFNAGALMLLFLLIMRLLKLEIVGISVAGLFTLGGFALFGKNLLNVWMILVGVGLFTMYKRENLGKYFYVAVFGTALAPGISAMMFGLDLDPAFRIGIGIAVGITMGFILPALASFMVRFHQGYNLYNVGFTAGIVGSLVTSFLRLLGGNIAPRVLWGEGYNLPMGIYLYLIFGSMIMLGYIFGARNLKDILALAKKPGRAVSDYLTQDGLGITLVNMGLTGIIATSVILIIGSELNGPVIGGIFTIVGFAAFGKHYFNILPIMGGVILMALISPLSITAPGVVLAILFSTALAPMAGEFGIIIGLITGAVHLAVVSNVGVLHGGINLYNNGFSAGFVAAILVPLIEALRREKAE